MPIYKYITIDAPSCQAIFERMAHFLSLMTVTLILRSIYMENFKSKVQKKESTIKRQIIEEIFNHSNYDITLKYLGIERESK